MNTYLVSLLPSLGLIFGHMFLIGNNVHMYSLRQLLFSFIFILAFALLLFIFNRFVLLKIVSRFFKHSNVPFCVCISVIFVFLSFSMLTYGCTAKVNLIFSSLVALCIFFLLYYNKIFVITTFISLLSVVSCCFLVVKYLHEQNNNSFLPRTDSIQFKCKPNIYLFWLESYHDFETLKHVYKIDNSQIMDFLKNNNFQIIKNTYSSASATLPSFSQCLTCDRYIGKYIKRSHDVARVLRDIIGGNKNNFVFRVLKNNGYRVSVLTKGSSYYMIEQGKFLDETDIDFGLPHLLYPILSINIFHNSLSSLVNRLIRPNVYHGGLFDRVKTAFERSKASGKPFFIQFKGGADHTTRNHDWTKRQEWISSNVYQNLVKRSDKEAEKIIDFIVHNDPSSIIILLGDHGAWSYRKFPWNKKENFTKYAISPQDVIDDIFRVLFAYRLSNGLSMDISYGNYLNNSNIFLHIFAYLSDNKNILPSDKKVPINLGAIKTINGIVQ